MKTTKLKRENFCINLQVTMFQNDHANTVILINERHASIIICRDICNNN